MFQVLKRDGSLTDFQVHKISRALEKAFDACNRAYNDDVISMIALRVMSDFETKIVNDAISVEEIQDSAEKVLSQSGYTDVAKAYILYRKQHETIRNIKAATLDYQNIVENYIDTLDLHIQKTESVSSSIGGLILHNNAALTANYWLTEIYDEEIANAHHSGDIHIHHLNMLAGDCTTWSLKKLIQVGLRGVAGKVSMGPAKHLSAICNQMIHFFAMMQNEWASIQTFAHFDTYLSAFVKQDHLSYEEVKQCMQSFVYGINIPSQFGLQEPLSEICFDWTVPESLKEEQAVIGNTQVSFNYGACQAEMDMIQRAFLETMLEGDDDGQLFHYPIVTNQIDQQFPFHTSIRVKQLFSLLGKYGGCRFRTKSANEMSGSIGLVTINLPRIAYLAKDQQDFFRRLDKMMNIAARCLEVKRAVLTKLLEANFYPYTKVYLDGLAGHCSTIGVIGMDEVGCHVNWLKKDIYHFETQMFLKEVLKHMNEKLMVFEQEQGVAYRLEATLSHSSAKRLATQDLQTFTQMKQLDVCQSLRLADDVFAILDVRSFLQPFYTADSLVEIKLDDCMQDWTTVAQLVEKIVQQYHFPYFSIALGKQK